MRATGVVLAAGAGRRFGGGKVLARVDGGPLVDHVLAAAEGAGLEPIVLVAAAGDDDLRAAVAARDAVHLVVNPDPSRGLSSSLRLGLAAATEADAEAAVVLLADQPMVRASTIRALLERLAGEPRRAVVVPQYADGGSPNPVVIDRSAFGLADVASGDRGLGPVIAARPDIVAVVDLPGTNPDVDIAADLADLAVAMWAERVRANREQVDRVREVPDGADFYATVSAVFRDDPGRSGDAVLDALVALARPDDRWLDIGAGAGRYALPLARRVREVIALDPSPGMLGALREAIDGHGIDNVRVVEGTWPDAAEAIAAECGPIDVAFIAHVGYDSEAILPFVEAMERIARRRCAAVMMRRSPAAAAEPFWPPVHGEPRVALPALPAFVDLLAALGRAPEVRIVESDRRRWASRDELARYVRRQLWVSPEGARARRMESCLDVWLETGPDGTVALSTSVPNEVGIVTWVPPVSSVGRPTAGRR